jgi:hypothetical protein
MQDHVGGEIANQHLFAGWTEKPLVRQPDGAVRLDAWQLHGGSAGCLIPASKGTAARQRAQKQTKQYSDK